MVIEMTVYEMIRLLSTCESDSEVRIVFEKSLGKVASVGIDRRGIKEGFDFDKGTCLITTDRKITNNNE